MQTIETSNITAEQLAALDAYAQNAGAQMRDALLHITRCVRDGAKLTAVAADDVVSPNVAAQRLGMSRTHLYKLLDRGEIPFNRVGRDRRIRVHDLIDFEARRQQDRHELAQRFASQQKTRAGAVDEVTDLL
ncbi:helix-turn-helix domain-containing protein [[Mycobacterium] burgundiense]|uniref:Helix-turn-helix domain-containing protein n=1 Tax=[Mycobacterium] burgundiense TaxID=3064286 RepID=A0ABM9LVS8_9MYCO|nr:helix-turn-helix domain-containing protein [Mycolicibacterium sp. MU0053]CAJ1505568.1 helix-turn-helix domain-containing protein [Mycolicibacterium sp. MU0053]